MCSVVVGLDDAVTVAFEPRTVAMAGDRSARDYSRQAGVGAGAALWYLAVAEAALAGDAVIRVVDSDVPLAVLGLQLTVVSSESAWW